MSTTPITESLERQATTYPIELIDLTSELPDAEPEVVIYLPQPQKTPKRSGKMSRSLTSYVQLENTCHDLFGLASPHHNLSMKQMKRLLGNLYMQMRNHRRTHMEDEDDEAVEEEMNKDLLPPNYEK